MGERTCGPLHHAEFHAYRGNVSSLRVENPIFGPLSKNNNGMAALRAGLPKRHTFSSTASARPTIPTILGNGDRGGPCHFCPNFFWSDRWLEARLLKIGGKMHPPRENADNFVVCLPIATKLKTLKLWPKCEFWQFWGLPHFCPDKREIWHGDRTCGPNFTFIGVCVASGVQKNPFWTTE